MNMISGVRDLTVRLLVLIVFCLIAQSAAAVDWDKVTGKDVVLFHPGQASWEWVLTQSKHSAAKKFRGGKNCADCHDGEQADIGALIASGEKLEPAPVKGADGSTSVNVKMARDDANLYVRFEWKASTAPQHPPMSKNHELLVTMIIGDENVKESVRAGCWGTCHSDLPNMDSDSGAEMTKYIGASRLKMTASGGGTDIKPDADLKGLIADGQFLEYWQAQLNQGSPAKAVDGYILDDRHKNSSPLVTAEADYKGGNWIVVLSRALTPGKDVHKDLVAGKTYPIGFAIHSGFTEGRFHHVSVEYSLSLDSGEAVFVAAKQ